MEIGKEKQRFFLKRYDKWLKGYIQLRRAVVEKGPGRPNKPFTLSSGRSKRRKTEELRETNSQELYYAASSKLFKKGGRAASKLVTDLARDPKRAKEFLKPQLNNNLTPQEALKMFVEAELSRHQYEVIRKSLNPRSILPSYKLIQNAKKETYPEGVNVTESVADVPLASLLEHTLTRLLSSLRSTLPG